VIVLKAENIGYEYPGHPDGRGTQTPVPALSGVDLSLKAGECVVILGPNGAGKSTLLKLLAGLLKPTTGSVEIHGRDAFKDSKLLAGKAGMLFQDPDDQIFLPTVEEDVAFGPANLGMANEEIRRAVERSIESVGIRELRKRAPHNLSHGEKKRVALAGILAMSPDILLLDEPTANLDPQGRAMLLELLKSTGSSMVVATHDVDAAVELADRVLVLDRNVLGKGDPENIFGNEALLAKARLIAPAVFSVFSSMKDAGIYSGRLPMTRETAAAAIKESGKWMRTSSKRE